MNLSDLINRRKLFFLLFFLVAAYAAYSTNTDFQGFRLQWHAPQDSIVKCDTVKIGFKPIATEANKYLIEITGFIKVDTTSANPSLMLKSPYCIKSLTTNKVLFQSTYTSGTFILTLPFASLKSANGVLINDSSTFSMDVNHQNFLGSRLLLVNPSILNINSSYVKLFGNISFDDIAGWKLPVNQGSCVMVTDTGADFSNIDNSYNGSFTIGGMKFSFDSIHIRHLMQGDSSIFRFYGGPLQILYKNDTLTSDSNAIKQNKSFHALVNIGTQANPGIVITNDTLKHLLITLTDTITMYGVNLTTDQLSLEYNADSVMYSVYGGPVTLIYNNDSSSTDSAAMAKHKAFVAQVSLGNEQNPGFMIKNGILKHLSMTITDTISMFGIKLITDSLSFQYDRDSSWYELYGGPVIFVYNNDSNSTDSAAMAKHKAIYAAVTFGNDTNPGLVIRDGVLNHLSLTLSDTIAMFGIKLITDSLTFQYDRDSSWYELYGGPVTFTYNNDSNSTDSAAKAKHKAIYADVTFGKDTNPGLVIRDGELKHLSLSLSDTIAMFGIKLITDSLTFQYDRDSSWYELYGGPVTFTYNNDSNSTDSAAMAKHKAIYADVTFGKDINPGLVIRDGVLKHLSLTLSDTIAMFGIRLITDSLTFQYDRDSSWYELFGGPVTFTYNNDKKSSDSSAAANHKAIYADVTFGKDTNPGLVIRDGALRHLNLTLTDTIAMFGIKVITDSLSFQYDRDSSWYELFGGPVTFIYNNDSNSTDSAAAANHKAIYAAVSFGNDTNPGMVIKNDTLRHLNLTLSDTIAMFGIKVITDSLTFQYDRDSSWYELFGGPVTFIYNNDKKSSDSAAAANHKAIYADVKFGNDTNPGLVIRDGNLMHLNLTLTDTIDMFGINFITNSLTFQYDRDSSWYELYGGPVKFIYNNDKNSTDSAAAANHKAIYADVGFGNDTNPGLVIREGSLRHLNLTLSDTIAMFGVKFITDSLTFQYDRSSSWYELYGGPVTFIYNNDQKISDSAAVANHKAIFAQVKFGKNANPGMVIQDGTLQHLNISMSSDMNIFGVRSVIKSLNFEYDKDSSWFEMYGGPVSLIVEKDTIGVSFGNEVYPGLTLQHGELKSLTLGVTGTFRIMKLSIQPMDLTVSYRQSTHSIIIYDSLKVSIDGQNVLAKLGDYKDPGLVINNGKLSKLNISISSDIKIGGMEFITRDAGLEYSSDSSNIKLHGKFEISKLWKAKVEIGTATNPGIIITDGSKLKINGLKIEAEDVNLGAAIVEQLAISYSQTNIYAACTLIVSNQFEAGGSIELIYSPTTHTWQPNKLSLLYQILPPKPGIAMGSTGLFLQGLSGTITNLSNMSNFSLTANLMISNGVPFYYGSDKGFLVYNKGTAVITAKRLLLTDTLLLGAYMHNYKWNSVIGQATATLDLNWYEKKYSITGELRIPTNYGIKVNGNITLQPSTMQFYGDVTLRTPSDWWLIGGKEFGNINGCMLINKDSKDKSFAAGWLDITPCCEWWCGCHRFKLGGQYNFGNNSFSSIGSSEIDDIKKQFNKRSSGMDGNNHIFTFDLDSSAFGDMIFARLSIKESVRLADVNVCVMGSDEIIYPVFFASVYNPSDSSWKFEKINPESSDSNYVISELYLNIAESFSDAIFKQNWHQSYNAIPKYIGLQKGKYEFIVNMKSDSIPTFEASLIQTNPHFILDADISKNMVTFTTHSWIPEIPESENDANVSIFIDNDSFGYDGELVSDSLYLKDLRNNGIEVNEYDWVPRGYNKNERFYFYAILKDSVHAPIYSDYTNSFTANPLISGQIINLDSTGQDSGIANILVYLDLNRNSKIDLNDILATNDSGLVLNPDSALDHIGVQPEPNSISDQYGNFYIDGHFRSDSLIETGYYTIDFYLENEYEVDPSSPVQREDKIYLDGNPVDLKIKIRKKMN